MICFLLLNNWLLLSTWLNYGYKFVLNQPGHTEVQRSKLNISQAINSLVHHIHCCRKGDQNYFLMVHLTQSCKIIRKWQALNVHRLVFVSILNTDFRHSTSTVSFIKVTVKIKPCGKIIRPLICSLIRREHHKTTCLRNESDKVLIRWSTPW